MVFPAHAGMSLALRSRREALGRFPRSRGDEPRQARRNNSWEQFSPLTRG